MDIVTYRVKIIKTRGLLCQLFKVNFGYITKLVYVNSNDELLKCTISSYVRTYATLSHLNDDVLTNRLRIVSFLTVADWSIRHHLKVKVSRGLLHLVHLT